MPAPVESKSKSLLGVTDLIVVADIKHGLIPALDSRSYRSRVQLLLKTLNTLRASSLEAEATPLIADMVTRVQGIHSFRLAVLEQPTSAKLLLNVVFDGGWEQYMRRVWRDLGPLLDVIFCNCEDYPISRDNPFADYAAWVRRSQVSTEILYNASSLTVSDLVVNVRRSAPQRPGTPQKEELWHEALPAIVALYRLTDMYPLPVDRSDGTVLLRAAQHLMRECHEQRGFPPATRTAAEAAAVTWFKQAIVPNHLPLADLPWSRENTQAGIVEGYEGVTHGCVAMVHLADTKAAAALLAHVQPLILTAADQKGEARRPFVNVAFTLQGLHAAGLDEATVASMPQEFREGMAARASALGDYRHNHPTLWHLPRRNWPTLASAGADRIELSSVHVLLLLQISATPSTVWQDFDGAKGTHPLAQALRAFYSALQPQGVTILAVQATQRFPEQDPKQSRDHFGFVDGISQPKLEPKPPGNGYTDSVETGDLLLGYKNSLEDPPLTGRLWKDSTFLVIRKLRQEAQALAAVLVRNEAAGGDKADAVKALMMGRHTDGKNLIDATTPNDFDYEGDAEGKRCPFQAHVRRANPRTRPQARADLVAVPRILRRGMSYGPRHGTVDKDGRGLVFMAYNASIGEQFEVIQSWLSGGNSSSAESSSTLRDPFLGVPQEGDGHVFEYFDAKGQRRSVPLDSEPPFVRLEWGLYAFVPSIAALGELRAVAEEADLHRNATDAATTRRRNDQRERREVGRAQVGARVIAGLRSVEQAVGLDAAAAQWKIALEDIGARTTGISRAVWAAVRVQHGGVLRTPHGVLVGSQQAVTEVFDNIHGRYTVAGYADRMRKSFGEIYLGLDFGDHYEEQSGPANAAIQAIGRAESFFLAKDITTGWVEEVLQAAAPQEEIPVEVKDLVDAVLAGLGRAWFGLPDGSAVLAGGWHWKVAPPPTCPGHFHSPSRYMFQPNPGPEAERIGQQHGQELKTAVKAWVRSHRKAPPSAPISSELFRSIDDDEQLASTVIGVMMGFLPTVDGCLRGVLFEWMNERSLWDLQLDFLADESVGPLARETHVLLRPLTRTLQLRPVPETVWRTARTKHRLGSVDIEQGDKIVVGIVSATQEQLAQEDDSEETLYTVFGGNRSKEEHPTHACPGYEAAMGVLLGVLAGLLESATLRPALSPVSLHLSPRLSTLQPARAAAAPQAPYGQTEGA